MKAIVVHFTNKTTSIRTCEWIGNGNGLILHNIKTFGPESWFQATVTTAMGYNKATKAVRQPGIGEVAIFGNHFEFLGIKVYNS